MAGKDVEKRLQGSGFVPGVVARLIPGSQDAERQGLREAATNDLHERIRKFLLPYEARFASIASFYNSQRVTDEILRRKVLGAEVSPSGRLRRTISSGIQEAKEKKERGKGTIYSLPNDAVLQIIRDGDGVEHPIEGTYHVDQKTRQPVLDGLTMRWTSDKYKLLYVTFFDGQISTIQYQGGGNGNDARIGISFDGSGLDWLDSKFSYIDQQRASDPAVKSAQKITLGSISYHYFDVRTVTEENPIGVFSPVHTPDRYGSGHRSHIRDASSFTYDHAGQRPFVSIGTYFEEATKLLETVVPDSKE